MTCDGRVATSRLQAFRRLALDSVLADIARLLQPRGVRPLLIKGPAFARWLYDDPRERFYNDIDLLLGPNEFEAAQRGLAELRFTPRPRNRLRANEHPDGYHEEWIRPGTLPIAVELHHTLWGVPAQPLVVWQRMTEGAQAIEVAGAQIDVPSEAASAFIVGLHAADHGSAARRPGAPPHAHPSQQYEPANLNVGGRYAEHDLHLALARVDMETWRAAAALADELGAGPLFAFGLRLDPAGRDVADRLGLTRSVPRRLRLRNSTPMATAEGIERLITTRGLGARARLVADELVPSRAFMLASSPLARRGRLGLAGAYLRRPFVVLANLPRGAQAWLQVAAPSLRTWLPRRLR
ncbi:MAG: nucleotidyltransferase family protein [Solirubrobacteraceae bacterium]